MVIGLTMRTLNFPTMVLVGSVWLMLEKIQMVHSSLSQLLKHLGLMVDMLYLGKY